MKKLAEIIGFVRKHKWVLLIPVVVIGLAFYSWGQKILLFAVVASVLFVVVRSFYFNFVDFLSGCNMSNEGIAKIMVFSLSFLLFPMMMLGAGEVGPISYYNMTQLSEATPDKSPRFYINSNGERTRYEIPSDKKKRIEKMVKSAGKNVEGILLVYTAGSIVLMMARYGGGRALDWSQPAAVGSVACVLIFPLLFIGYYFLLKNISLGLG